MELREMFSKYSPFGDLTVVSICFVMIVLMMFSYITKSRSFRIFLSLVSILIVAALSDVTFYTLATSGPQYRSAASAVRCLYHFLLFLIFLHFVIYIVEVTRMSRSEKRPYLIIAGILFVAVVLVDVIDTVRGENFILTEEGIRFSGRNVFFFGYIAFVSLIIALLAKVRKRLYKRVMYGFYGSMAISFGVLLTQGLNGQASFTVATFFYPIIAMFYIMHSNPYDVTLGAIDRRGMEDTVAYHFAKRRDFLFISLYLKFFNDEGKTMPEDLQASFRHFTADFFKGAMLFRVGKGHVILMIPADRNPNCESQMTNLFNAFRHEYHRYHYDYKIVIGRAIEEISRKNEYVSFVRSIHRNMDENTIHWVEPEDVKRFNRSDFILKQLEDIYEKCNLDDPRVLAYCQPVYNIRTGKYDTAEALMRLRLDDAGLVFPDQFIPLAEENGYIHVLTEIILHKTCDQIAQLTQKGYEVSRISVNVSMLELEDIHFCDDITRIIDKSGISGDKIALELTESQTDSDFMLMKDKISQLRDLGIKFYLDDFGTGYSNMERIMELPFDIIKFDRSLVSASEASERSRTIVVSLAHMFSNLEYSVLYEGVEKDSDEKMCMDMDASYLQGYKYSRPVPIEKMEEYFEK